jgi:hypothetical protein
LATGEPALNESHPGVRSPLIVKCHRVTELFLSFALITTEVYIYVRFSQSSYFGPFQTLWWL